MKYFKNTELAKLYHVSEKSVRNWIQSAKEGKIELELYTEKDKPYIANTSKNTTQIEELVQKGRKYKNTRGFKNVSPRKEFYKYYNQKQILDIISNISIHREIPVQYSYVNGGAEAWDRYTMRQLEEETPNLLNTTIDLLEVLHDNIENMVDDSKIINVIDLGPGNGVAIKKTLERLTNESRLGRYIAIDISQEMLDIAEKNIKTWFGDKVEFEGYVRDICYERFNDLIVNDANFSNSINVIFLLGGTLSNFRSPNQVLENINNSMDQDDLLVSGGYLDSPATRRFFDFHSVGGKLPVKSEMILNFLNIDQSLYEADLRYVEEKRAREGGIRLNYDIAINIDLPKGKRVVELYKNDRLLLWRYWHRTLVEIVNFFDKNEFEMMISSKSIEQDYYVMISKVKITRFSVYK